MWTDFMLSSPPFAARVSIRKGTVELELLPKNTYVCFSPYAKECRRESKTAVPHSHLGNLP